jgi:hypothetical protein
VDTIEVLTTAVEGQMSAFAKRMGHVLAKVSPKSCFDMLQTSDVDQAVHAASQCCPGCAQLCDTSTAFLWQLPCIQPPAGCTPDIVQ